jgi:hypothetical protein
MQVRQSAVRTCAASVADTPSSLLHTLQSRMRLTTTAPAIVLQRPDNVCGSLLLQDQQEQTRANTLMMNQNCTECYANAYLTVVRESANASKDTTWMPSREHVQLAHTHAERALRTQTVEICYEGAIRGSRQHV